MNRDDIRKRFPALDSETVFLENAGGSQVPGVVADRMREYMLHTYVQLDAGYALSAQSTATVDEAHEFVNLLMGGTETGKVVLGHSCSALCKMLADCYAEVLEPGDEIIVAETAHEANVGPWMKLDERGMVIRMWKVDPESQTCSREELESLLNERTRIVAFPHVSNLLGGIVDVRGITELAHRHGAEVVVDGVAFAPHRAMAVTDWDVDWYAYSTYKVYGPHMGALYGKYESFAKLTGPNHYFIPSDEVPYKFELGGASHEGCAGILALGDYLKVLAGTDGEVNRQVVHAACEVMTRCEAPLQERMIRYLLGKSGVRLVGPQVWDRSRVGTISFVHDRLPSREIAAAAHAKNIGIRNGHMYAHRLCQALAIDPDDGVVRVSLVHYNSSEEIERLIEVFEQVL